MRLRFVPHACCLLEVLDAMKTAEIDDRIRTGSLLHVRFGDGKADLYLSDDGMVANRVSDVIRGSGPSCPWSPGRRLGHPPWTAGLPHWPGPTRGSSPMNLETTLSSLSPEPNSSRWYLEPKEASPIAARQDLGLLQIARSVADDVGHAGQLIHAPAGEGGTTSHPSLRSRGLSHNR